MKEPRSYFTRRRRLFLGQETYLVGILNLTPDSFSDGGAFVMSEVAVQQFHQMVEEGAAIIDVGGESTRPGHTPVPVAEEIARVVPFIKRIRPHTDVLISVDTSKSAVAEAALEAGADIVNDIHGALGDPEMARVMARQRAACILMYHRPEKEVRSGDVMQSMRHFLEKSIDKVLSAGVREDAIALDPGLGFGKTYEENWEIMRRLHELCELGYPVLIGASKKSMIARLLKIENPAERVNGTLATTALAIQAGVDFIRVHDVRQNRECANVIDYCLRQNGNRDNECG